MSIEPILPAGSAQDPAVLADRVKAAVLAVDGVVDLAGGISGEVATYLPGRSVPGIRLPEPGTAEVHVVIAPGHDIPDLAARIQRGVIALGLQQVQVHIDDLREPEESADPADDLRASTDAHL